MDGATELSATLGQMRPVLMNLARLQLRNEALAEDAVSETMLAALEQAGTFGGRSKVRTWVVGILKHKVIDQLRRHKREISIDERLEAEGATELDDLFKDDGSRLTPAQDWGSPEELLSQKEFFETLQSCIDQLPANVGRVFLMREWLEYETHEICKELNITTTNCHVMLFRARLRLRECVEHKWLGTKVKA
jgi:RNA polymerase sigma-70 factor (ECF subfamily)